MLTTYSRRVAVSLSLAFVAACDSAPTEPAATSINPTVNAAVDPGLIRTVDEYRNDLTDRSITLGCDDGSESEFVQLRGYIIERFTHIQLPTGTVLTRHDARPDGLWGVGTTTGQAYDVVNRLNSRDIYADRGIVGNHRETWELKNRVTGEVFSLTYAVRYVMDADRNLIVHREQEHSACRGNAA
jgi:hypothetical protein